MGRRFAAQVGAPLTAQPIEIKAPKIGNDRQNGGIERQRSAQSPTTSLMTLPPPAATGGRQPGTARLSQPACLAPSTPVESIELDSRAVVLATPVGDVRARAAILTVSTSVLAGGTIILPHELDPWRHAAARLPLGRNEKLFLEIAGDSSFAPETRLLGDPRDRRTGVYFIRPFGWPVIECFLGDQGARMVEEKGPAAGFAHATDQLAALFGSAVSRSLRPLVASNWSRMTHVGGAYSHALPGHAAAREDLAHPFEQRLFFAGEATHVHDYSTAHGAHDSGVRAAEEAIAALAAV